MPDRRELAIARNEALFREVNERRAGDDPGLVDYTCECGKLDCHAQIRLGAEDYRAVRHDDRRFFVCPGHEIEDVEQVVDRHDNHWVVEKPPERCAGIESRQAAPVDRAAGGDQRGAVTVADQPVFTDRQIVARARHCGLP